MLVFNSVNIMMQFDRLIPLDTLPGKQIPSYTSIACQIGYDDIDGNVPEVSMIVVILVETLVGL